MGNNTSHQDDRHRLALLVQQWRQHYTYPQIVGLLGKRFNVAPDECEWLFQWMDRIDTIDAPPPA